MNFFSYISLRYKINFTFFTSAIGNQFIIFQLNLIIGIITSYLVLRVLDPQIYGYIRFVLLALNIVSLFTIPQFSTALTRYIATHPKSNVSLKYLQWKMIKIYIIGGICLLLVIPYLVWNDHAILVVPMFLAAILFVVRQYAVSFAAGIIYGTNRFIFFLYEKFITTIFLLLIFLPYLFSKPTITGVLLYIVGLPALVQLVFVFFLQKQFTGLNSDPKPIQDGLRLSIHSIPVGLLLYADGILLVYHYGFSVLAIYSAAFLIAEQVRGFFKTLQVIFLAKQSVYGLKKDVINKITYGVLIMSAFLAISLLVYIFFAQSIVTLLFPATDINLVTRLSIIALFTTLAIPLQLFVQCLQVTNHTREYAFCMWIPAVLALLALIVLVPQYAVLGCILAQMLYYVLQGLMALWYTYRISYSS